VAGGRWRVAGGRWQTGDARRKKQFDDAAVTLHFHPTIMPTPSRKPVEHPLLPGEASSVLSVVAFLYGSSGALYLIGLLFLVGGKIAGASWAADAVFRPLGTIITIIVVTGYLATGWLLMRRRRLGGMLGLGFTVLSLVQPFLSEGPVSAIAVLVPAALLVGLALAWTHLDG
jgi:hypothetical protein